MNIIVFGLIILRRPEYLDKLGFERSEVYANHKWNLTAKHTTGENNIAVSDDLIV